MSALVVLIGPESSGKTTLTHELATRYDAPYIEEYARCYLAENRLEYCYEDILDIAKEQAQQEQKLRNINAPIAFADTNLLTLQIWCELLFCRCHIWIINQIASQLSQPALYLLTAPDLEWEYDPMRSATGINEREAIFCNYKSMLMFQHIPWKVIQGKGEERIKQCMQYIGSVLAF